MTDIVEQPLHPDDEPAVEEGAPEVTESEAVGHYFGKFGTFLGDVGHRRTKTADTYAAIHKAVKDDSRVVDVTSPAIAVPWSPIRKMNADGQRASEEELLSGSDHLHVLEFSEAFAFEVHVPQKNQPLLGEIADVPTDHYWAAWDGVTVVVIWKRAPSDRFAARSAGHVVEDILRVACASVGVNLVVQPCSPKCTNMFSHRDLRITQKNEVDGKKRISFSAKPRGVAQVDLEFTGGPMETVSALHDRIQKPSAYFAEFKNLSQRLMDIERLSRRLVDELLQHDYDALIRSRRNVFVRVGAWVASGWRSVRGKQKARTSQSIIASLWIAMSRIESIRRDWLQVQRRFTETSELNGRHVLYEIDRKDDDLAVSAIDTLFIRGAVEHKSSRMDNRVVVTATVAGAVAGGLVAVAGTLIALALSGGA